MAVFNLNLCKGSKRAFAHFLSVLIGRRFSALSPRGWGYWKGPFAWTPARVGGKCWRCLGRSEQTSPSQAFLELTLTIWVEGRASDQPHRVRAFLPAAAEYLLAELAKVSFCSLPLSVSPISDRADLWMVRRRHKPPPCYCFLNPVHKMYFEEREMKKDCETPPRPAATHCNAGSSRFLFSLKVQMTKRQIWCVNRKLATASSLLDQNKEPFTASTFFCEFWTPAAHANVPCLAAPAASWIREGLTGRGGGAGGSECDAQQAPIFFVLLLLKK